MSDREKVKKTLIAQLYDYFGRDAGTAQVHSSESADESVSSECSEIKSVRSPQSQPVHKRPVSSHLAKGLLGFKGFKIRKSSLKSMSNENISPKSPQRLDLSNITHEPSASQQSVQVLEISDSGIPSLEKSDKEGHEKSDMKVAVLDKNHPEVVSEKVEPVMSIICEPSSDQDKECDQATGSPLDTSVMDILSMQLPPPPPPPKETSPPVQSLHRPPPRYIVPHGSMPRGRRPSLFPSPGLTVPRPDCGFGPGRWMHMNWPPHPRGHFCASFPRAPRFPCRPLRPQGTVRPWFSR